MHLLVCVPMTTSQIFFILPYLTLLAATGLTLPPCERINVFYLLETEKSTVVNAQGTTDQVTEKGDKEKTA